MEFHEAAAVFPMMDESEFAAFKDDIAQHGLLEPIVVYEDKILDGRNRWRACGELKLKPDFVYIELDGQSPVEYTVSKNLHRRHLTMAQRAALALELMPKLTEQAQKRQQWAGKPSEGEWIPPEEATRGKATRQAAKLVGIGASTVETAIAIQRRKPEVIAKMRSGEIKTVDGAARASGLMPDDHAPIADGRPKTYYGKGDKWREASQPLVRYLRSWRTRDFQFRHVNPTEARRRLKIIEELMGELEIVRLDLEERAVKATTRVKGH